jgi:hypothetical protein
MKRYLIPIVCLALASCSTAQVQSTCAEAAVIAQAAAPFLVAASPEVKTAVTLLGAGAVACGSPEYAAARGRVLAFLASRGIKTPQ